MKRALILGITGQDGSYLAEILLEKGYEVHGLYRHSSTGNLKNIEHILDKVALHGGDMLDPISLASIIYAIEPDEIYNEADQDNANWSHSVPAYNADITYKAVGNLLEIIRVRDCKLFQPCTALMFGNPTIWPQTETSPFDPRSPYAIAKCAAFHLCRHYRREYGVFVSTAILYNHVSPRRSEEYLLPKICRSAVRISRGMQDKLELGSLDTPVDIGSAREYMEAAHDILQLDEPTDFIIGSGRCYPIRDYVRWAFEEVGIDFTKDESLVTINIQSARWTFDEFAKKPPVLVGDIHKAQAHLNFNPSPVQNLISRIVAAYEEELS